MDIQPSPGDGRSDAPTPSSPSQWVASAPLPTDRNAKWYFAHLPRHPAVRAARRAGALGSDEQVLAVSRIDKFSQGVNLLVLLLSFLLTLTAIDFLAVWHAPWFAPLLLVVFVWWIIYFGRHSYLYVTDRRVVLTSFVSEYTSRSSRTSYSRKSFENVLSLERPVYGLPNADPNRFRPSRVTLPPPFASFLGRETVYVSLNTVTDYAFKVAMTPPPTGQDGVG